MEKIKSFEISFTNSNDGAYFAGQYIEGVVSLVVINGILKVKQIRLEVNGYAKNNWTELRAVKLGKSTTYYSIPYSESESYFSEIIELWPTGVPPSEVEYFLQPGSYKMPFSSQLPTDCPPSFEGAHGHIRYTVKAIIDQPANIDKKVKTLFTVINLLDLNHDEDASRPLSDIQAKELKKCICCVSGHLSCSVNIDRSGYVSGENIPLNFEVTNNSSTNISYVTAKLVENVTFVGKTCTLTEHTKLHSRVVVEEKGGFIAPGDSQYWHGRSLHIPALVPTLRNCSIIKVAYELQIKAKSDRWFSSLEMHFPIIVGNVPLHHVYQNAPSSTPPNVGNDSNILPLPQYPNLRPSFSEQSVFGGGDIQYEGEDEHTDGPRRFSPVYLYYNISF